jgi:hypothetical protein
MRMSTCSSTSDACARRYPPQVAFGPRKRLGLIASLRDASPEYREAALRHSIVWRSNQRGVWQTPQWLRPA